jgi:hypothetical protein
VALAAAQAVALQLPAGTAIEIRLTAKIGTKVSQVSDPVEGLVIAPVMAGSVYAIPAGAPIHGVVEQVQPSGGEDQRALLVLRFNRVDVAGAPVRIDARVTAVDNAREKVDDQGHINGILVTDTATGRIDSAVEGLGDKFGGFASVLSRGTKAVAGRVDTEIAYDAGVEMSLQLIAPATLRTPGGPGPMGDLRPVPDRAALVALAAGEPFQTVAQKPPKNSDLTNLMLVGQEDELKQAFNDAGWHIASGLNPLAKFETAEAVAEDKGYAEAPVSVLLLEGKPPDLVFEKLNNTFAHRHHLRVWLRPDTFHGRPVWVIAATHDMGINFSETNRTFIHRIDSSIDREREKVADDLVLTGRVDSMLMVERSGIPQHAQNATGDNLATDGKIAVLVLK